MGSRARAAFRGAAAWGVALVLVEGGGCGRFGYERLVPRRAEEPDAGGTVAVDSGVPGCEGCDAGPPPVMACIDGVLNQNESGIDCGGVCPACDAGPASTCFDGALNQDETGVDCGGVCAACDAGAGATCSDGVLNQDETTVDCGGVCAACDAGLPPAATCSDGVLNQDETTVDCGGVCLPCIPTTCSVVVADSAADFSGVQGQNGWHYGYYEEPSFSSGAFIPLPDYRFGASVGEMGWFAPSSRWTWIGRVRMHPNGRSTTAPSTPIEQHAVRRWVSTTSETLFVQGTFRATSTGTRGVIGRISVGDDVVWELLVPAGQTEAHPFETLVSIEPGDVVNFELDPYQSHDGADDTEFAVQLCR